MSTAPRQGRSRAASRLRSESLSKPAAPSAADTPSTSASPLRLHDRQASQPPSIRTPQAPHGKRPPLAARANSAPHVPDQHPALLHGEKNGHIARARHVPGEDYYDDDISLDPFFLRYNPDADRSDDADSSDTQRPPSPPVTSDDPMDSPQPSADAQDINIAIVGDDGVGKTKFIDRAFDLRNRASSRTATRKMSIDGAVYTVRLVEIPFGEMDFEQEDRICWPDRIDDMAAPRFDGALMLYDVMNQESLAQVPGMLNVVHKTALPCVLVGCKCDNHPAHRQVDPAVVEQRAKALVGDLPAFQSSDGSPESQRICLSVMLRAILASRQDSPKLAAAQRRRATSNSSALRPISPRPSWTRRHERASSEFSGSRLKMQPENDADARTKAKHRGHNSFLDLEESPGYESYDSDGGNSSDYEPSIMSVMPSDENGYTFDQLVDRLVEQPVSKQDTKFVAIFLALYRKFAAPTQLLDAIIIRFDALEYERRQHMLRTIVQLRHLAIMEQWLSTYPGDFAHVSTKRKMTHFVNRLSSHQIFAVASKEILADLEVAQEDDDTDWACSDKNRERAELGKVFTSSASVLGEEQDDVSFSKSNLDLTISITKSSVDQNDFLSQPERSISTSSSSSQTMLNAIETARRQAKLLVPIPRLNLNKAQWHMLMGEPEENIARELTRIDWAMFSSIRPRDLVRHVSMNAAEKRKCKSLDNVDRMIEHFNHLAYWVTNFILLRDKPKHRALTLEKFMRVARKLRELNNYNSLGAILAGLNGTAIHRLAATRELISPITAKDFMKLEILMGTQKSHFAYRLAWENSSGERIPYLPLHRRDLVSAAEGNATFVSDPSKRPSNAGLISDGNTPRQTGPPGTPNPDVVVGNPTAAAALQAALNRCSAQDKEAPPGGVQGRERINWKKFAIMGEVIVGMQRAQGVPYPNIMRNDEVKGLVLDVKICKDDDELYDRSTNLEAVGAAGEPRRRFANWFRP